MQRNDERSLRTSGHALKPSRRADGVKSQKSRLYRFVGYTRASTNHILLAMSIVCSRFSQTTRRADMDLGGRLSRNISSNGSDESSSIVFICMGGVFLMSLSF